MTTNRDKKAALRQERLAMRDAISPEQRIEKSLAIADHAGDEIDFLPGTVISGFFPIRSEMDVRPLMARLRSRGARLGLPVVVNKATIVFRELVAGAELVETGFGTSGPGPDADEVDPAIMLVPLAAFDATGHRIGYGAGFYDRAIDQIRKKGLEPRLIGIAFDVQEVAHVPAEPHDVGLDAILTESGLRHFR